MSENDDKIRTTETQLPWGCSSTWKDGDWYPLPVGFFGRKIEGLYIIEGYDIFKKDPDGLKGDIIPVDIDEAPTRVFSDALWICEIHNKRRMLD